MVRGRGDGGFTALRAAGGILPAAFLQRAAAQKATHQESADYGLPASRPIREEVARQWGAARELHRTQGAAWVAPFLCRVLGYADLRGAAPVAHGGRLFRLTHQAFGGAVPLLLTERDFDLERADPQFGAEGRRQAPHGAMQEYLNAEDAALWGMVSNGSKLRILRDNASLTRPAYIEADLDLMFADALYAEFAALWLCAHASRLRPVDGAPAGCILEGWRREAGRTGERARAHLRAGVEDALCALGNGFLGHPDNAGLREALRCGALSTAGYFRQLLRLVYRLLFLFSAEARDLLHGPDATKGQRDIYRAGYSLERLCERARRRRHYDGHRDAWAGLQTTFCALAAGAPGLGLPALGGMFRAGACPDLDGAAVANQHLLEAVHRLAFFRPEAGLTPVNYRDMDTEELGSVYESLLELRPVIDAGRRRFAFAGADEAAGARGSERKLTGSYYTPPALVRELIQSTLDPLIARAVEARPDDPRAAILDLRVVDPACGSGHFLLAAARRLADAAARADTGADPPEEAARRGALRAAVQHCIYGVDRNPLAVELCKAALWTETVEPGKPLTFLDAHIRAGDSLVGLLDPAASAAGIPAAAYKALTGDDRRVCRNLRGRNRQPAQTAQGELFDPGAALEVAVARMEVEEMREDTLADVARKEAAWTQAQGDATSARETLRADLFTGAYFAPKRPETLPFVPDTGDMERLGRGRAMRTGVADLVKTLADAHRFFHWHLAFPEVMADGGFDVVLGNPPWDQIQLDPREFFSTRDRSIAEQPTMAARNAAIAALAETNPLLHAEFQSAKRAMESTQNFIHNSGRFPTTSYGRLNSAPLFAELAQQLVSGRGRVGMVVPTGIATDAFNQHFFANLVKKKQLVSLFDFENREAIFPIHRSYKFCLLTMSGEDNPVPESEFAFFLHQTAQLKEAARRFTLGAEDFALFNPNTRTCPIFRTRGDMEVARKMYHRGVLWKETEPEDNPWGVSFQLMFMMNTDSHLFRTRTQLENEGWELDGNTFVRGDSRYLPLYEGKMLYQYDHRFATFDGVPEGNIRRGNAREMTPGEKTPEAVAIPRYWVPEEKVAERLDKEDMTATLFTEPNRTEPNRTEPNRTEPNRDHYSTRSRSWLADRFPEDRQRDQRADGTLRHDSDFGVERFRDHHHRWFFAFRNITGSTVRRTAIFTLSRGDAAMNEGAPIIQLDPVKALHAFRDITNWTTERTLLVASLPDVGTGHTTSLINFGQARAVASALVLANMNSIPLDWAARRSVGGTHMSLFIVKQLPVLRPEEYLKSPCGRPWVEMIIPRVVELTYTSADMAGFAQDLGFHGPPFAWEERRRHRLRCELDAIFGHMYGLDRADMEWILDAPPPSASFPTLKKNEIAEFGEYRTKRYVLAAFDALGRGEGLEAGGDPGGGG